MPRIVIIAAIARNGVIGRRDGALPWHLPEDLARFREVTWGKPLIMGRRTYVSIGRPLPGRRMIIVTRNPRLSADGIELADSLEAALARASDSREAMIAGGAEVYTQMLERADAMHLTWVDMDAEGEVLFPVVDWSRWRENGTETVAGADGKPGLRFVDYVRV